MFYIHFIFFSFQLHIKPMATNESMHIYFLLFCMVAGSIHIVGGMSSNREEMKRHHVERRQACPDPNMCRSKWGYCGTGDDYCGDGCVAGPCKNSTNSSIVTDGNFACVFNTIDDQTRANRLNGFRNCGWAPSNNDEAAVFLAHVFHETDGLKTLREYCAPGESSLTRTNLKISASLLR